MLNKLFKKGLKTGFISYNELVNLLLDINCNTEEREDFIDRCCHAGIEVLDI